MTARLAPSRKRSVRASTKNLTLPPPVAAAARRRQKKGQRPRIGKVQAVHAENLHVVVSTMAYRTILTRFEFGKLSLCKKLRANFNTAASCMSLNRAKPAVVKVTTEA